MSGGQVRWTELEDNPIGLRHAGRMLRSQLASFVADELGTSLVERPPLDKPRSGL